MGVVILTADERHYKTGDYIESKDIQYSPVKPDTTYIVHLNSIKEKEIERWLDVVSYRLVFVVEALPKLSERIKEKIIIDKTLTESKQSFKREIDAMFRWGDRNRVKQMVDKVPIPLAIAFLRENRIDDIRLWRLLADTTFVLPEMYSKALLAYGVKPINAQTKWPKKKKKEVERPSNFRESDIYWEQIISVSAKVRNEIREADEIPHTVKKTKERILDWI